MGKKIAYINESLNTGSTGHIVEQLGLQAQSRGYECVVAHGARYIHQSALPSLPFSSKPEEYLHGGLSLFCNAHGLGSWAATDRLVQFLEEWKPDIIHLHNIHGYYLHYPRLFAFLKAQRIPVVWTLHDCWPMTGRCAHFTMAGCSQWKTCCRKCPSYNDYPRSLVSRHTEANFSKKKQFFQGIEKMQIISVSQWLDTIVGQSILQHYPHRVIHNGINTTVFHPVPSGLPEQWKAEGQIVLLGVASQWTDTKGWSDWLQLFHRLDERCRIVLVGVNAKQKGMLPPNCIPIDRTDDMEELVRLYSAADIYINLAHQESFGLTLLEAMSCGTPCISYNTTAINETVPPALGEIIQDGDINAVADAVYRMGKARKQCISEECRLHVVEHFEEKTKINEYLELYSRLI